MALMQFDFKVKDSTGNIYDTSVWENSREKALKYLIDHKLTLIQDYNTLDYLLNKDSKGDKNE